MLNIKGVDFTVKINAKRIKNIYLKVEGNIINASKPYYCNDYEVYNFINSKREWIYNAYLYYMYRQENTLMYGQSDVFNIFGKPYKLIRTIGRKKVEIIGNNIYFSYKDESQDSIKALYKYLDEMLLVKANEYLDKYDYLLKDYGYNLRPNMNARIMSSKWGVCFTRKNKITISSYLIHYPYECLEYIVLHELTHFIVPNHSKRFYDIIKNNIPNYKEITAKLK